MIRNVIARTRLSELRVQNGIQRWIPLLFTLRPML